jgi:parvulin-like peptidyl-prolyl isomerase
LQLKPFYILKIQGQVQMEGIKWIENTFVKEFKDVAFSLQQGEISDFETDFGFHIIYVEKSKDKKLNYVIYYWLLQYLWSANCR